MTWSSISRKMAALSPLDPGVGEALEPGVAEATVGEAVGTVEEVGDGELDGDEPPQAARPSRSGDEEGRRRHGGSSPAFWHGVPGWRFLNLPAPCP